MPNKSSKAGHIAERTCVVCREKTAQTGLYRFIIRHDKYIIDVDRRLGGRGYYCCKKAECLDRLEKWVRRYRKRRASE